MQYKCAVEIGSNVSVLVRLGLYHQSLVSCIGLVEGTLVMIPKCVFEIGEKN